MNLKNNIFISLIGLLALISAGENKAQEQEITLRNNTKERALKIEEFYGNSRFESDPVKVLQPGQTAAFKFVKKDWRDGKSKELTSFSIEDQTNVRFQSTGRYLGVIYKPRHRYAYMSFLPLGDTTRIEMDVMPKVTQMQSKALSKIQEYKQVSEKQWTFKAPTQQDLSQLIFDIEEPEEDAFIVDPVDEKTAKEKDEQRAKEKAAAKQAQAGQEQEAAKE